MSSPSIVRASSPPYSPKHPLSPGDGQPVTPPNEVGSSRQPNNKYSVALHSVRVTKFGYIVDPLELRYPEIMNQMIGLNRRASFVLFDSAVVGHKLLSLIRGFWSQPAFPKGRLTKPDEHYSITDTITAFKLNPLYPHKSTYGTMTRERHVKVKSKSSSRRAANILKNLVAKKPDKPESAHHGPPKPIKGSYMAWIPKIKEELAELIGNLCMQMETVFSREPRILNIKSPCLVLGDIHGNLTDLRTYERSLWPKAPSCITTNYLFLGDYVDRGEYSVECVLYLFSMKLLAPDRFFLLRGNHEVASIQRQYTFEKECEDKFGIVGRQLWRNFNKVFDLMPIAAVIDNQIFCAHGGIPRSVSDLNSLATNIPSPLDNPEIQSPAAWEILWNDPITDSELINMVEMDNVGAGSSQNQLSIQQVPTSPPPVSSSSTNQASKFPVPMSSAQPAATAAKDGSLPEQNKPLTQANIATPLAQDSMNEADRILSRESNPLSFYIRPDNQEETRTDVSTSDDESTLRTVPSDTSSIASTSPQQIINDGFVPNIKRGTAFLFSDQAVKHFLNTNKLSHVIRAHEVIPTGFAFHGDGRVITIFSSSQYCGLNNQVAGALVERNQIRILRLDSGDVGE